MLLTLVNKAQSIINLIYIERTLVFTEIMTVIWHRTILVQISYNILIAGSQ